MRIKVKALRPFKDALGYGDMELERPAGETIEGLIRSMAQDNPAFAEQALDHEGGIDLTLNIMVSGRPIGEHDLNKKLEDGDEVLLFMPLSGG